MKKFFVPGNISCLFKICADPNPAVAGSLGVGFTINKGIGVYAQLSEKTEVFWNGEKINFPTIISVVQKLTQEAVSIFITSELPLGCGFGLSGASALGTAYAINNLFDLKKEKLELAKIAHIAEVENGTGLGDVVNEYFGGFLLKTVPSSKFIVQQLPIKNVPVYVKYFSKVSTKDVLSDTSKRGKIDIAGENALAKVQKLLESNKEILFKDIIAISKEFAQKSGLLKDRQVIETIQKVKSQGGHASMIMLGNAVFADIPFEGSAELVIQ